jgi:hypothetical protein
MHAAIGAKQTPTRDPLKLEGFRDHRTATSQFLRA